MQNIDTEVRSIGTCKNCKNRTLHLGTIRERNGLLCPCDGSTPVRFTICKGSRSAINWRTVKATTTHHECDSQCTNAKSTECACSCGGENHGRDLVLAIMAGVRA